MAVVQPVADFVDMTELRNNLVSLLENKISALDQKLLEMRSSAGFKHQQHQDDAVDAKVQRIISETSKVQPSSIEQRPFKAEEKSIDELQKEIIQALQRLEQVEIDKD
jgi:small-conductance mechanosensitive channel